MPYRHLPSFLCRLLPSRQTCPDVQWMGWSFIGAAALLKLPDLMGPAGNGVRGPALVGALFAAATA